MLSKSTSQCKYILYFLKNNIVIIHAFLANWGNISSAYGFKSWLADIIEFNQPFPGNLCFFIDFVKQQSISPPNVLSEERILQVNLILFETTCIQTEINYLKVFILGVRILYTLESFVVFNDTLIQVLSICKDLGGITLLFEFLSPVTLWYVPLLADNFLFLFWPHECYDFIIKE